MPMIKPKNAVCTSDLRPDVLCCSCCGRCGAHAHGNCAEGQGMSEPVVSTCGLASCRLAGVLCCTACGWCGKHPHNHFGATPTKAGKRPVSKRPKRTAKAGKKTVKKH